MSATHDLFIFSSHRCSIKSTHKSCRSMSPNASNLIVTPFLIPKYLCPLSFSTHSTPPLQSMIPTAKISTLLLQLLDSKSPLSVVLRLNQLWLHLYPEESTGYLNKVVQEEKLEFLIRATTPFTAPGDGLAFVITSDDPTSAVSRPHGSLESYNGSLYKVQHGCNEYKGTGDLQATKTMPSVQG